MPIHHPDTAILASYSAGSLREPQSLVVATHLTLCPECLNATRELEALGGALLDEAPLSARMSDGSLAAVLARLEEPESPPLVAPLDRGEPAAGVPQPLWDYLGAPLGELGWKRHLGGIAHFTIDTSTAGHQTFLLRLPAGRKMPVHTHRGTETTLVLTGAFADHTGEYARGDFVELDGSIAHQPIVDEAEECICLAVLDAPVKLTGAFGRLLNPFLGF